MSPKMVDYGIASTETDVKTNGTGQHHVWVTIWQRNREVTRLRLTMDAAELLGSELTRAAKRPVRNIQNGE